MTEITFVRSQSREADLRTGLKKSARAARMRDGLLTSTVAVSKRARAFLGHELDAVAAAVARGADDEEIRAVVRELEANRKNLSLGFWRGKP